MRCPDVNILIYAHRRDAGEHRFYRSWMEELASGPEPFALSALSALAFVRIVTQPHFPGGPTPMASALAEIENLIHAPACRWVFPGPRHWEVVSELVRTTDSVGKHVGDAQHAAVALENGCVWATCDSDFERFQSRGLRLEILNPG